MAPIPQLDAVIVGGGIAGLWLANLLYTRGDRIALLEARQLGSGQTLASQGMIHGGIKYALGGSLTSAAQAIAGMPNRWRDCLNGEGDIDLSDLKPLAADNLLFADGSGLGRFTTFFASRTLRGRLKRLESDRWPEALQGCSGWVYALNILGKMAYAPAVPLLWTMIADAADYAEWTSGRRATGLFFSAATFAQKGGWGIGGALAGWLLAAFGYVEQAGEQTVLALTGIKLLISVFPGLLYASCALALIFYPLDEQTCATMKRDLDARREGEEPTD